MPDIPAMETADHEVRPLSLNLTAQELATISAALYEHSQVVLALMPPGKDKLKYTRHVKTIRAKIDSVLSQEPG
jgi:hypothetical protein